jgi:Zn-finger nucleic acid-binding protein
MLFAMVVACRGCAYRFEALGYRDAQCPVCHELTPSVRSCPACANLLTGRRISDVVIDSCSTCGGIFLDTDAKARVLDKGHEDRAQAIMEVVARETPASGVEASPTRACPTCSTPMARTLTSDGSGVVVDVCKPHGMFLDAGELHRIIEYAQGQLRDPRWRRSEAGSSTPMTRQDHDERDNERENERAGEAPDPTDSLQTALAIAAGAALILIKLLAALA